MGILGAVYTTLAVLLFLLSYFTAVIAAAELGRDVFLKGEITETKMWTACLLLAMSVAFFLIFCNILASIDASKYIVIIAKTWIILASVFMFLWQLRPSV